MRLRSEQCVNQQFYKNLALWVVILVVMLLLFTTLKQNEAAPPNVAYSEFMDSVRKRGALRGLAVGTMDALSGFGRSRGIRPEGGGKGWGRPRGPR